MRRGAAGGSAAVGGGDCLRVGGVGAADVERVGRGEDGSVRWVDEASRGVTEVVLGTDDVCGDAVVPAVPATLCTVVVLEVVVVVPDAVVEVLLVVAVVVVTKVTSSSIVGVTARLLSPSAFVRKFSTSCIHLLATRRASP